MLSEKSLNKTTISGWTKNWFSGCGRVQKKKTERVTFGLIIIRGHTKKKKREREREASIYHLFSIFDNSRTFNCCLMFSDEQEKRWCEQDVCPRNDRARAVSRVRTNVFAFVFSVAHMLKNLWILIFNISVLKLAWLVVRIEWYH